jgi:hypothetical protein
MNQRWAGGKDKKNAAQEAIVSCAGRKPPHRGAANQTAKIKRPIRNRTLSVLEFDIL